tara:strand:+ start:186 stop:521 length:336 start_codon:yes stop_codon:yes gene_type:complete
MFCISCKQIVSNTIKICPSCGGRKFVYQSGTDERSSRVTYSKKLGASEKRAIEILESKDCMTKLEIRKKYKMLIKDLHPDMNLGEQADDSRLKEVIWAWKQIKDSQNIKSK